jgi:hypothetical protein
MWDNLATVFFTLIGAGFVWQSKISKLEKENARLTDMILRRDFKDFSLL